MSTNDSAYAPAIAPPLVILICIAGAIVLVVIFAAMYHICLQSKAEKGDDLEGRWNPNNRNKDQDEYMKEVRWRNNAMAWDTANTEQREYRRGWFREHIEEQRARDSPGFTPGEAVSAEEYLSHVNENPYQDLLKQKAREIERYNGESRISPGGDFEPVHLSSDGSRTPHTSVLPHPDTRQQSPRGAGVKITVNDDSEDIVDTDFPSSNKFPPRQSRMFRSSSIYSGDGLLPTNHLHLVQSSSKYALRNAQSSTETVAIAGCEQKDVAI